MDRPAEVSDVLLTLVPLLLAAVVTLELCALLNFPLNYANIIALPVLLGVGVAFKIYYVMAWRSGQSDFLQSPLTRAVLFSALMTATAFGSLSFSSHPGMASMASCLPYRSPARSPPPPYSNPRSWEVHASRRKCEISRLHKEPLSTSSVKGLCGHWRTQPTNS